MLSAPLPLACWQDNITAFFVIAQRLRPLRYEWSYPQLLNSHLPLAEGIVTQLPFVPWPNVDFCACLLLHSKLAQPGALAFHGYLQRQHPPSLDLQYHLGTIMLICLLDT